MIWRRKKKKRKPLEIISVPLAANRSHTHTRTHTKTQKRQQIVTLEIFSACPLPVRVCVSVSVCDKIASSNWFWVGISFDSFSSPFFNYSLFFFKRFSSLFLPTFPSISSITWILIFGKFKLYLNFIPYTQWPPGNSNPANLNSSEIWSEIWRTFYFEFPGGHCNVIYIYSGMHENLRHLSESVFRFLLWKMAKQCFHSLSLHAFI